MLSIMYILIEFESCIILKFDIITMLANINDPVIYKSANFPLLFY